MLEDLTCAIASIQSTMCGAIALYDFLHLIHTAAQRRCGECIDANRHQVLPGEFTNLFVSGIIAVDFRHRIFCIWLQSLEQERCDMLVVSRVNVEDKSVEAHVLRMSLLI